MTAYVTSTYFKGETTHAKELAEVLALSKDGDNTNLVAWQRGTSAM